MAISERKRLEQIEIHISGTVFLKWRNEIVCDSRGILSSIPHREPYDANDPKIDALIADHLSAAKVVSTARAKADSSDYGDGISKA